jgi:hypothetical protein
MSDNDYTTMTPPTAKRYAAGDYVNLTANALFRDLQDVVQKPAH